MPETLTATTHVGITRLAGQIGAEITGADTGTPLSDEVVARIRQALLDHKVVFLRGQSLNYRRQVQLRMAHQMLAAMGAEAFAERARRELVATGETVRKRTVETHVELTAQERQIARRARDGYTNAQIGAKLFLSARTVEWHLRKVFAKLGISSRRELHAALPDHGGLALPA